MDYHDTDLAGHLKEVLARKEEALQRDQAAMEKLIRAMEACVARISPLKQKHEAILDLLRENEVFCSRFRETCLALYKTLSPFLEHMNRSETSVALEQELVETGVLQSSFAETHEKTVHMLGNATEPCSRRREQLEQLREEVEAELIDIQKKRDVLNKMLSISQRSYENQSNEIDHLRAMLDDLTK